MKRCCLLLLVGAFVLDGALLQSQEKKDGVPAGIVVDKDAKTLTIEAKMAPRIVLPNQKDPYRLEVIATAPYAPGKTPSGEKAHETIVTIDSAIKPSHVQMALESLGLKAGTPVMGEGEPKGPAVNVYFLVPDSTGLPRKVTLDRAMIDKKNGKPFPKNVEWRFTGSSFAADSGKPKEYDADKSGTFLSIFPVTSKTVFQTSLTVKYEPLMDLEVNTKVMPKVGTPVKLVIEVKK